MLPPAPPPPPRPALPPVATQAPAPVVPQQAFPAAVPGRELKDLPNTTIRFYDVPGKNLKAINKSLAQLQQQQRKDASGHTLSAATGWAVNATFRKLIHTGQCKVTSAQATFTATANLPKLANEQALSQQDLATWRRYIAGVEATQAASLWFVYDHIHDVEKAILASSCEGADSAGSAAVQQLRSQAAEFQRTNGAAAPATR
jgi:predicted secreted Zn-dependent protease